MNFEHSRDHKQHRGQEQERHHRGQEHDRHHHEHFQKHRKSCTVNTSEEITITTPVIIQAYANSADVELTCGGHDIIREHCRGRHHTKFKIIQKIHACIPIEFVAECEVGDGQVDFDFQED